MNLDDPSGFASVDASDTLGVVERTADQWAEAAAQAREADGLPSADGITGVAFCGMGGSGIAGDVLQAVAHERGRVPVSVVKGYELPSFVDEDTLVIVASYSGNTEETLSCFEQAIERKARIVTLTTGGALAARAAEHGLARLSPVAGIQPRAALASLAAPTLIVAQRLGVVRDLDDELAETHDRIAERVAQLSRDVPAERNDAKQLAQTLNDRLSLTWGQDGLLAVAALRWRCQLNENAKVPAFSSVLPELDHNELVGYDPGLPGLRHMALVVLRQPREHPRVALRIDATLAEMRDRVGSVSEAHALGDGALARFMTASLLGDFTSVYLALLRGVDPTPVAVIERLKKTLA